METIKITKIFENEGKTGTPWWRVLAADGQKYSVWADNVRAQLSEGATVNCGIEVKGDFKTIKSVIPAGFMAEMDTIENKVPSNIPTPASVLPRARTVADEIAQVMTERMKAMELAVTLAAAGKIGYDEAILAGTANQMLKYFRER